MYANLGDVYTKLARRAYEQSRELELGGDASPEQKMDKTFPLPEAPIGSSETETMKTEPRDSMAERQAPATESQNTAAESKEPAMGSRKAGTKSHEPVMESRGAAAEQREPEVASAGTLSAASEAASMSAAFCAHAGGFEGRRAVADAALWLQSHGAEVIEVRHEERRIASSYRVYLPPFASREEAVAKMREIRNRGVRDVRGHPGRRLGEWDFVRDIREGGQHAPARCRSRSARLRRPVRCRRRGDCRGVRDQGARKRRTRRSGHCLGVAVSRALARSRRLRLTAPPRADFTARR